MSTLLLALLLHGSYARQPGPSGPLWEQTAEEEQVQGYHPMIRFCSWDITRFNRSTTYMFVTPDMVQQGQFEVHGAQYSFRAVMAHEFENADKAKLLADMDPARARELDNAYARSMLNFSGDYHPSTKALSITYLVHGKQETYALHDTTEGDDQLSVTVSAAERGLVGLWQAPDPFPDKLDARTRYKIDEQGLLHFAKDAAGSEGALFAVMDLHTDNSFRSHGVVGTWSRDGATLTMVGDGKTVKFQISADGTKLLLHGKPVYVR